MAVVVDPERRVLVEVVEAVSVSSWFLSEVIVAVLPLLLLELEVVVCVPVPETPVPVVPVVVVELLDLFVD